MGLVSTFFENPAVKILEDRLWETARKRYLGAHPSELRDGQGALMRKVRTEYKDAVAATVKEADKKLRASWGEFRQIMKEQLKAALSTVLHMSNIEWYAVEIGQLPFPSAIAVPYPLLKRMTADLLPHFLRKRIDFENLNEETLDALATYAVEQRFQEVLEEARHNHEPFTLGSQGHRFTVVEILRRDAYFLGEDQHHSMIDMVILSNTSGGSSDRDRNYEKAAYRKWFDEDRKNRRDDRRFTGDGWEIDVEELKSWAAKP